MGDSDCAEQSPLTGMNPPSSCSSTPPAHSTPGSRLRAATTATLWASASGASPASGNVTGSGVDGVLCPAGASARIEAAGARVPMVATNVGGIPEIYGPFRDRLGPPDDPENLRARLEAALQATPEHRSEEAASLAAHVAENFSIRTMANSVMAGYGEAMERRRPARRRAAAAALPTHT